MPYRIVQYKKGSRSATALARAMSEIAGERVLKVQRDSQTYVRRPTHKVINWGCSTTFNALEGCLNSPENVGIALNKLTAFERLRDANISIPEYTADPEVVNEWLTTDPNCAIFSRTVLNGSSGRGMFYNTRDSVAENGLVIAPLYVKYIKKKYEYRVHIVAGEVIDIQQKRKRLEREDVDYKIRNSENGWVFCREDIVEPTGIRPLAISAVEALGLDFGAVDIIFNEHHNMCYVLEVNTACGLEGQTILSYANAFINIFGDNR